MGPFGLEFKDHVAYLYRIEALEKIVIDIRDENQGRVDLRDFANNAIEWLEANWQSKPDGHIAASLFVMNMRGEKSPQALMIAEQFFAFGALFERMRRKLGLTINLQRIRMTAEAMEKKMTEIDEVLDDDEE